MKLNKIIKWCLNKMSCNDSLKTSDAEPNIESLWHDASEEPQGKYYIVCQDTFENVFPIHSIEVMTYDKSWVKFVVFEYIVRWAYVKDLLPKGGEK